MNRETIRSQWHYFILAIVLVVLAIETIQGRVSTQLLIGALIAAFLKTF